MANKPQTLDDMVDDATHTALAALGLHPDSTVAERLNDAIREIAKDASLGDEEGET